MCVKCTRPDEFQVLHSALLGVTIRAGFGFRTDGIMAYNLATIDGQTAMMFVGEPPWHGLGKALAEPPTAAEAIKAAHLDWEIAKVPLHIQAGEIYRRLPEKFAVVRADTLGTAPKLLGVVGAD